MTLGAKNNQIQASLDQLFSEILLEQQKIDKIKGPDEDKKAKLKDELENYSKGRGRGFFYDYLSTGRGHGPFTELVDGSIKYDLIGGIGYNLLGHSHPLMIKACLEAATVDSMMCGNLQAYEEPKELTQSLLEAVKDSRLKHFWFACSGSFANDIALKILWQKQQPKYGLITFEKAFAGRSVATQEITANAAYREGMPQYLNIRRVPHFNQKEPGLSLKKTLESLNQIWDKEPNSFCAIMLELVQGEAGFVFGTKDYYEGIFQWAKEKGIYVWVDEVQTFGRTHELFAFQMYGLEKYVDIVTVGKALHACGVLFTEELNPKPGLIAGTFHGSIPAIKTGSKVLNYLLKGNFYGKDGKIQQLEKKLIGKLSELAHGSCKGKIGYIGGIGTMISFEIGDSSTEKTNLFVKKLFENGIIVFTAGKDPMRVRLLPPLCLTDEHINEIFQIIEKTIQEVV